MRDILPEIICIIVIVLSIVAFLFFVHRCSVDHDNELWNNGHCNVCGSAWEYEQAVGHRASTSYIYVCKKCGKRIEINEVR